MLRLTLHSKILVVYVGDVRIEKEVSDSKNDDHLSTKEVQDEGEINCGDTNHEMRKRRKLTSVAPINIPPQIINLLQVGLYNNLKP